MKNERRRQLEQNDLAGWLEKFLERTKEYHSTILISLGGIIVVFIAVNVFFYASAASSAKTWNDFYNVDQRDPEALKGFGEKSGSRTAAALAFLGAGDEYLRLASVNTAPEQSGDLLKNAKSAFESAEKAASVPALKQRARLGLGQTYERLALASDTKENLERAKKYYQEATGPNATFGERAKNALAILERENLEGIAVALKEKASTAAGIEQAIGDVEALTPPPVEGYTGEIPEVPEAAPVETLPTELPAPAGEGAPLDLTPPTEEAAPDEEVAPAPEATPAEEAAPAPETTPAPAPEAT
ncbi:MAG: hypothetical protein Q4D38_09745, partial [Planctomycetia bacterium]|nr:hypothetical protein [Planctomycetia bacterium]